ncbi:MAG: TolC family protein [Bacteroidetes bacterium]|nr:TolC family protein [Bacteroidota bacterium]
MRLFYALMILVLLPGMGAAQIQINNWQALLQYADEHAPASQLAKLQPLVARQDVNIAASGLYPRVNAFGTGDYYPLIPSLVVPAEIIKGPPGTYTAVKFGLPYVFTAGAEVSIPVVNLEKWAQLSRAKAQYSQAEWGSKASLENFHIQLVQAYYQSLVTKEVLKLNDENVQTANELMQIMDARNKQGVLNPADYNRTKNLQLDVQSTGINYSKTLQQSNNNIASLLDMGKDSVQLSEVIDDFSWPLLTSEGDAAARPGWQEADMKVYVAQKALSESKNSALPKLVLNGRYTYNMQSKFEAGSDNVEFNSANVGLRLDFPLFQGNYYRSTQYKSALVLRQAKLEQERTRATLTQQQKDWFDQYAAAFAKHTVLDQKVKTASDNLRIARLNVKEGLMEFDEFNNIFMEYNKAKMEYIQNLADGILYYLLSTQKF